MPLPPLVALCHPSPVSHPHIPSLPQGNPGVVTYMRAEDSHGRLFRDGDLVTFSGVEGMAELNDREPIPVHVLGELPRGSQLRWPRVGDLTGSLTVTVMSIPFSSPDAFRLEIGDTSSFSPYRRGGLVSQVQLSKVHSYVSSPLSPAVLLPRLGHCRAVPCRAVPRPQGTARPSPGTVPPGAPAPGACRSQDTSGES